MKKITIIGSGNVGATTAYTLMVNGIADEIVMIDINNEKSMGEAQDMFDGTPYQHSANIYAGDYIDAVDSDIVILTSGVGRKPGQTRLELAQVNFDITKSIIPKITKAAPNAMYIIVANPVDILTYAFYKYSDIPANHIVGTGTLLDTARLRSRLSKSFAVNQSNVHAVVLGEHGDSSFVPWSLANISGVPVKRMAEESPIKVELDYDKIEDEVRKSGSVIIGRKGATFYGVAACTAHLCKCILSGVDTAIPCSTLLNGEYGISDICLSLVNVIGKDGIRGKLTYPLSEEEVARLQHSAEVLKETINNLK